MNLPSISTSIYFSWATLMSVLNATATLTTQNSLLDEMEHNLTVYFIVSKFYIWTHVLSYSLCFHSFPLASDKLYSLKSSGPYSIVIGSPSSSKSSNSMSTRTAFVKHLNSLSFIWLIFRNSFFVSSYSLSSLVPSATLSVFLFPCRSVTIFIGFGIYF
jgi:hypothetical protein